MDTVAARSSVEPLRRSAAENARPALPRLLEIALWLAAVSIVAAWLALVALHVSDGYRMTHRHGVWIAAAESAREGRLYPPLFDGEHYAGTRYMPVPILLNAAASAVVGDPLTGGKVLAAVLMAALLALVVVVLRRVSCPWSIAVALAAAIVATETGLEAGTTIGGDLVAAVLQLGAVAVALQSPAPRSMVLAGILAGVAVASKLTGTWGSIAIITWLAAQRRWRPAATFTMTSMATAGLVLGAVQVVTGGGLSEHLVPFSAAGVQTTQALLRAPNKLLHMLTNHAYGALVLLPLAVVGAILVNWRRQPVVHIALGYALLLLLVVYTDVGTGFNQLLDVVVLSTLAVGVLAGRAVTSEESRPAQLILLTVAVCTFWAGGIDLVRTIGRDLGLSVAALRAGAVDTPVGKVVAGMVRPDESLLSADPSIDVALGRRPLVMDPFMLVRLDRTHPGWVDPLIAKIEQRQFDVVVMVVRLENPEVDFWWTDYHFGPRVARALRTSYRLEGNAGRYHLYRPNR